MADDQVPGKLSDGLDRLLFGPVYLVAEVISCVSPGLLFYLVLLLNKNQLALSLFHLDFHRLSNETSPGIYCYMIGICLASRR
jgi:hypothetical protein